MAGIGSASFEDGGDDNDIILAKQLVEFLSCQACHHPVYPIITGCQMGHFVCVYCQDGLMDDKCALCNRELIKHEGLTRFIRNAEFKFECRFKNEGCGMKDAPQKLAKHETSCVYRYFKCGFTKNCQKSKDDISFSGIEDHLRSHGLLLGALDPQPVVTLGQEISFKLTLMDFQTVAPSQMDLRCRTFRCDQTNYGLRVYVADDLIHLWVFSFNKVKDVTEGYCTIKVKRASDTTKGTVRTFPLEVTFKNLRVYGIRGHTFGFCEFFGNFGSVRHEQFEGEDSMIVSVIIHK